MNTKYPYTILFSIMSLCLSWTWPHFPYEPIIDGVTAVFFKEYMKPMGYCNDGYGGEMHGDVRRVYTYYVQEGEISIDEARRVYLDVMEELLTRINATKKLRPYLHNYPFQRKNIQLALSWRPKKKTRWEDGKLTFMFLNNNDQLLYYSYSADRSDNGLYVIHAESYVDALAIVRGKQDTLGQTE